MKKSEMECKLRAAEHLMNARAKHIEQLKYEIQIKEAQVTTSQAYITWLARNRKEIKIPKKELSKLMHTSTIVADVDENNYIIRVVKKEDLQKPKEEEGENGQDSKEARENQEG